MEAMHVPWIEVLRMAQWREDGGYLPNLQGTYDMEGQIAVSTSGNAFVATRDPVAVRDWAARHKGYVITSAAFSSPAGEERMRKILDPGSTSSWRRSAVRVDAIGAAVVAAKKQAALDEDDDESEGGLPTISYGGLLFDARYIAIAICSPARTARAEVVRLELVHMYGDAKCLRSVGAGWVGAVMECRPELSITTPAKIDGVDA